MAVLPQRTAAAYGATPPEHLRRLRRVLIDSDNLMGPRQIIATVHEQIRIINALRRESRSGDRRELGELLCQFGEFAAWLHQDAGEHQDAQMWLGRALQWSHTIGDRELTSYVLARQAQLAAEMGEGPDVIDLASAAQAMAAPGSRLSAIASTYAGLGHALAGEQTASGRAFDAALESRVAAAGDPSPWGAWLDESYVQVHRAQSLETLGDSSGAASIYTTALEQLPDDYHRDRGVYLARAAVAHAGASEPEQAAALGLQALGIAQTTASGRILTQLARLDEVLRPWETTPDVIDLRAALDDVVVHQA